MFLLTLFPNTQRGCSLRDAINKMRCRYISVGTKGRCVCSPVQGRAAGTSVCVMACQQQFKRAAPAVQSMLPSLPPSSPMTCRTGRWRPGFHKNTARSLFCVPAVRWRTCRNRAVSVQSWNRGKRAQTSACASPRRHPATRRVYAFAFAVELRAAQVHSTC